MSSWSFSSYSTALQCLRKYRYLYVDLLKGTTAESSDLVFGSAIHSAINASLTGGDGQSTFQLYWSSYEGKDISYGRYKWEELAQIGAGFLRKFEKYHASKYVLEFAEKRLYSYYGGIAVEGTPDFFGTYQGRPCLRDFKTSSRNYESEKAQCATQLYLYAYLCIANDIGRPETLGYTVFNKAAGSIQDLTWEFNSEDMQAALNDMSNYVGTLELTPGSTYPRNLSSCLDYNRRCEFWSKCHKQEESK